MHCFSIDLQSNHPDTLCVQTQNAARTRRNLPSLHTYSDEHKCNFLKSAFLHTLYSKHIIRKLIEKMHSHHNMKKRKFLILLWNENEMKTNNLEYCVQESKRTLRGLHLMFAIADSPDRMSNIAQGLSYTDGSQYLGEKHALFS